MTVVTLSGTLQEKGKALEEKEVAIQNVEAARVQREEAQKSILGKYFEFSLWLGFIFSQLILIPLIRAKAEGGGRGRSKRGGRHRTHSGSNRVR